MLVTEAEQALPVIQRDSKTEQLDHMTLALRVTSS